MSNTTEHKRFCEREGWKLYKQTDHYFYRKKREDGSYQYTKISMGRKEYGKKMWREILKNQLECDQTYFNSIV